MLEVLDPEQNNTFTDHYLEVEYDLSNVMFLTTANSYNMPGPLLDRMEIIPLAGYTEDEKREIAKQHLIPKQIKNHGLRPKEFKLTDEALNEIIRRYTREAGVRNLEREIAKVARKALTKIVKKETERSRSRRQPVGDFLGVKKYRYGLAEKEDQIGVVTGLAWTSVGGDLLSIEALRLPGKGRMKTTGKLGDVMKESIDAASSYVRSIAPADRGEAAEVRQDGHPRPRARRRDAQGRAVGGSGDGDLDRVGADADPGAQGHRHDRRGRCAAMPCRSAG
jgi:ATP-dependent Lon protease